MQEKMLRPAARHHRPLQLHGAAKPAGLLRTYPNELAREAALNHENNKWEPTMLPDHALNISFTRLLAGPATYPWVASGR